MRVLYFASARELAGCRSEDMASIGGRDPAEVTVAQLLDELSSQYGRSFGQLVERSTVMVGDEVIAGARRDVVVLSDDIEVAILPPVSGGSGDYHGNDNHGDHVDDHGQDRSDGHDDHRHNHGDHHVRLTRVLRAAVLTISDRASDGVYEDLSGPALEEVLTRGLDASIDHRRVVPDSFDQICQTLIEWTQIGPSGEPLVDLIITNGGTGLSPSDVTPEAVRSVLDVEAPGLGEVMRSAGLRQTPLAALSRQIGGRRNQTVIIAVPGSLKGATESLSAVLDVIPHLHSLARASLPRPVAAEPHSVRAMAVSQPVAAEPHIFADLSAAPLDVSALINSVRRIDSGALVSFEGTVRSPNHGHAVLRLEYEAWQDRVPAQLQSIAKQVAQRFDLTAALVVHRVGTVGVGEPAVVVVAVAVHRDAAFEGGRELIDRVKAEGWIWKKEFTPDGAEWVEGCQ